MHLFQVLAGCAIGIILFQSALIAPVVLKTLDPKSTSSFLRSIWPKFFVVLFGLGCPCAILLTTRDDVTSTKLVPAAFLVVLPVFAYVIIPATNRASDQKDHAKFKTLHRLSVFSTLALLADYCWLASTA